MPPGSVPGIREDLTPAAPFRDRRSAPRADAFHDLPIDFLGPLLHLLNGFRIAGREPVRPARRVFLLHSRVVSLFEHPVDRRSGWDLDFSGWCNRLLHL